LAADAKQISEGMADLRQLLQRTATALGVAAGAVLTGLTYARLHEIFPIPQNVPEWTRWLALLGMIAAVVGSALLAGRFFAAQRRILIGADLSGKGLGFRDKRAASRILKEHAGEEQADSLLAVEQRALRLERIARRLTAAKAGRAGAVKKEADRLYAFVGIALVRAAASILENRTRRAFLGVFTVFAFLLAAGGIGVAFGMADYYKGQRDLADARAKCRMAESAGVLNACAAVDSPAAIKRRQAAAAAKKARTRKAAIKRARATLPKKQFRQVRRTFACLDFVQTRPGTKRASEDLQAKLSGSCVPSG
jgi:hypothetical protein